MEEALSGLGESCGRSFCAAKPLSNTVSKKISIWSLVLAYVDAASRVCFGRGTVLGTFNQRAQRNTKAFTAKGAKAAKDVLNTEARALPQSAQRSRRGPGRKNRKAFTATGAKTAKGIACL